jgi:hypothetical protein
VPKLLPTPTPISNVVLVNCEQIVHLNLTNLSKAAGPIASGIKRITDYRLPSPHACYAISPTHPSAEVVCLAVTILYLCVFTVFNCDSGGLWGPYF